MNMILCFMYMHHVINVSVYTYENFRLIKQKIRWRDWKTEENGEKHEIFVWHSRGGSILDLKWSVEGLEKFNFR